MWKQHHLVDKRAETISHARLAFVSSEPSLVQLGLRADQQPAPVRHQFDAYAGLAVAVLSQSAAADAEAPLGHSERLHLSSDWG